MLKDIKAIREKLVDATFFDAVITLLNCFDLFDLRFSPQQTIPWIDIREIQVI